MTSSRPVPHGTPGRLPALIMAAGLAMAAAPAAAGDGARLLEHYQKLADKHGLVVDYGALDETGEGSFVVRDLQLMGAEMSNPVRVRELVVTGAQDTGDDGFAAESARFSGLSFSTVDDTGKEIVVTVDGGEGSGLYLPDPDNADAPLFRFTRSATTIGAVRVLVDGNEAVSLTGLSGETVLDETAGSYRTRAAIESATFHAGNITDPQVKARFDALDIDVITLSARFSGLWDMHSGRLELTEYSIDAPDLGRFDLSLAFEGYSEEVARELRRVSTERNAAGGGDAEAREAASRRLLEAIGQLKLAGGRVSFADRSLTGRLLDLQAAETGGGRGDVIEMASAMALGMTLPLENTEFSLMLGGAVRAFLSQPGNFSISLEPEAPVAVSDIVGAAIMSPAALIRRLGVKVRANE